MKQCIDPGWRFYLGGESPFFGVAGDGIPVDLPHDFSIMQKRSADAKGGASHGYFPGGLGCYRKSLPVPEAWRGREILLEFEGVYRNAEIRWNGQLVGRHLYGYTGFFCDVTPYVQYGAENTISVNVNNDAMPNSRWYSGSGIYRHVWLTVREPVHIAAWGMSVTTPSVSADGSDVCAQTTVENDTAAPAETVLRSRLLDRAGREVAAEESRLSLPPHSRQAVSQTLRVEPARLWSVNAPYLYRLCSEVVCGPVTADEAETPVGIRSLSFSAARGFCLNGEPLNLRGCCVHHDCGILGAASYDRAEERKVELLRQNGFNAVRCAHNPPAPAFLDACDRLGMLVIDEAFDCWQEAKNPHDFGAAFADHWRQELEAMILRDRNHPSIILWSDGNEILERDGRSDGYAWARSLADAVRALDPTRGVTNALCPIPHVNDKVDEASLAECGDVWGDRTEKFARPLDVVGYNYLRHRCAYDGRKYPGRIICATESYPSQALEYWDAVEQNPHVIGDFVWTGLDYLGEAGLGRVWYGERRSYLGEYPWHAAFCGDLDICGNKRPQSYYRDCIWGRSATPYIAVCRPEHYGEEEEKTLWSWSNVAASWDWPGFEGRPVHIAVYSTDSEVELFCNGRSLGRRPTGKAHRYQAEFETEYEPGELTSVGYRNGRETARTTLKTPGRPAAIRLRADRTRLDRGREDIAYVTAEIVDAAGLPVFHADTELYFTVSGAGRLLAVGSGDPCSEEMYVGHCRRAYEGKALAVVRAGRAEGEAVITAAAEGFPAASLALWVGRTAP